MKQINAITVEKNIKILIKYYKRNIIHIKNDDYKN